MSLISAEAGRSDLWEFKVSLASKLHPDQPGLHSETSSPPKKELTKDIKYLTAQRHPLKGKCPSPASLYSIYYATLVCPAPPFSDTQKPGELPYSILSLETEEAA